MIFAQESRRRPASWSWLQRIQENNEGLAEEGLSPLALRGRSIFVSGMALCAMKILTGPRNRGLPQGSLPAALQFRKAPRPCFKGYWSSAFSSPPNW